MPDMSKSGSHLAELLDDLDFKKWEHRKEATKHQIMADTYEECERKLRRALDKEKEIASQSTSTGE